MFFYDFTYLRMYHSFEFLPEVCTMIWNDSFPSLRDSLHLYTSKPTKRRKSGQRTKRIEKVGKSEIIHYLSLYYFPTNYPLLGRMTVPAGRG